MIRLSDLSLRAREHREDVTPREVAEAAWLLRVMGAEGRGEGGAPTGGAAEPARPAAVEAVTIKSGSALAQRDTAARPAPAGVSPKPAPRRGVRLAVARAVHRIAPLIAGGRPELDLVATVRCSAAASRGLPASPFFVFAPRPEPLAWLCVLVDASPTMAPWRDEVEQLVAVAAASGRFARVRRHRVQLHEDEVRLADGPFRTASPGQPTILLIVTDGLGRGVTGGGLARFLGGLPQDVFPVWVHPWGPARWTRTPLRDLAATRPGARAPGMRSIALVPFEPREIAALEGWVRGADPSSVRARWLVEHPRPRPVPAVPLEDRIRRVILDPGLAGARRLVASAATVPGRLDVPLLRDMGKALWHVPPAPLDVAQALTLGFLAGGGGEVECRPEARPSVIGWLTRGEVERSLRWLGTIGERGTRLGIPVRFLAEMWREDGGGALSVAQGTALDVVVRAAGVAVSARARGAIERTATAPPRSREPRIPTSPRVRRRIFRSPAHWISGFEISVDGRNPVSPSATLVDISGAGCGFHASTPLRAGTHVVVSWRTPGFARFWRPRTSIAAIVVHAQMGGGRAGVAWSEGWSTSIGNLLLDQAQSNLNYVAARLRHTAVELLTAPRRYELLPIGVDATTEAELRESLQALADHPTTFPARGGGEAERDELQALLRAGGPREGEVLSTLCHWLGRNIVTVVRGRPDDPDALIYACTRLYRVFVQHGPARFLCGQSSVEAGVRLATEAIDLVGWAFGSPPPPRREASIKRTVELLHHQLRTGAPFDPTPLWDHLASRI